MNGNGVKNYFLWLLQQVEWYEIDTYEYKDLLWDLFNMEFTWVIDRDANRASKGLGLRYEFNRTFKYNKPCSVLEMLIALSRDWEHELTYDFQKGDRSSLWFWVMLENLDILDAYHVEDIVHSWLVRDFDYNGVGSPFPLKKAHRDQRNLEIWLQVNDFVMENVEI